MDILDKARQLESRIARTVDRAARGLFQPPAGEPLEVASLIVDAVEDEVQPAGRGQHVFPFNRITARIVAPSREARARFEAVFEGDPTLRDRIVERLRSAGCPPADLTVTIEYVSETTADWASADYQLAFDRARTTTADPPPDPSSARLVLHVVAGSAERSWYSLALPRVDLGRCAEVRDGRQRLLRANHVAFADTAEPPNHTVSRRHAHISYALATGHRLHDDCSEQGTWIVRNGTMIAVPSGARGVRLRSGDEIALGAARLRVTIDPLSGC